MGKHIYTWKPRIAVIGGGIGGASTIHFLTGLFKENLKIDLYEPKEIGGRLATIEINKNMYEAGGSIIHPRNKYMQDFVTLLDMKRRPLCDEKGGIWDGNKFVFQESNYKVWTLAKLWHKYGLELFKLHRYVNYILSNFENIYKLQNAGKYFTNVTSLLMAMNKEFPDFMKISIKDHLLKKGFSDKLIEELVKATLVVNYGQSTDIQSFVGLISLAAANAELWAVKGGNKEVPKHLIRRSKHTNVIPSYVKKICYIPTNNSSNQYEITYYAEGSTDALTSLYDIVIVATPLTHDQETQIIFENFPNCDMHVPGDYQTMVVTFIRGNVDPQFFGLKEMLDSIISCDPRKTKINALQRLYSVEGPININSSVWKIFSQEPLNSKLLNSLFPQLDDVKQIVWKAYPHYSTVSRVHKFKLHRALYYVNAIEWAGSAMEMSAIAGRNVAILAYNDFFREQQCSH